MDNSNPDNPSLIQSRQNPKIKFLAGLRKKRDRDRHGCFLVEGGKELVNFLAAKRPLEELFHCPKFTMGKDQPLLEKAQASGTQIIELSPHAFEKCSNRENPDGWLGLAKSWHLPLDDVVFSDMPLLLVLEGTEKPGNLGAILRTANAAGVDAVICNDLMVDLFNPNVIRASRGLLFPMQVAVAEAGNTVDFLKQQGIRTAATVCGDGEPIWSRDLSGPMALVLGNESIGLSEFWQEQADIRVSIPIQGLADSLNLSSATAICIYEILRQNSTSP